MLRYVYLFEDNTFKQSMEKPRPNDYIIMQQKKLRVLKISEEDITEIIEDKNFVPLPKTLATIFGHE